MLLNHYLKTSSFQNVPCPTNQPGFDGTCFTGKECEEKKGINAGICAEGFGVCCICKSITYNALILIHNINYAANYDHL